MFHRLIRLTRFFSGIFSVVLCVVSFAAIPPMFLHRAYDLKKQKNKAFQLLLLTVTVNDKTIPDLVMCYRGPHQEFWIARDDLLAWHLLLPKQKPITLHGKIVYPLSSYTGISVHYDSYQLALSMVIPIRWFVPQDVDDQSLIKPTAIRPKNSGGFINYDLHAITSNYTRSGISAETELGFFNRYGVGTSNFLLSTISPPTLSGFNQASSSIVRLNTTWEMDEPEHIATWKFGDSISQAATWSDAVQFGGIEYGTNFGTQPNLITYPLPAVRGQAVVPSNLSVFVNSRLQQQRNMNAGPFYLQNIPVVTGAGMIRVVTQDLLGRQQLLSIPYYVSPQLLRPGLDDYSIQAGLIRNNYGIRSFDYGRFLFVGKYNRGLTSHLTLATHIEELADQQTLGETAAYLWKNYGVWSFSIAGSRTDQDVGALSELGFIRQTENFSFGGDEIIASPHFTQVGLLPDERSPVIKFTSFGGYENARLGSLSASFTWIQNRDPIRPSSEIVTLNYNRNLFHRFSLNISGLFDLKNHCNNQVALSLTFGFDGKTLSQGISYQDHSVNYNALLQKPLPMGPGFGYNLLASHDGIDQYQGSLAYQNNVGTYSARYSRLNKTNTGEFDMSGSVVHLQDTFLSRQAEASFAVVHVPMQDVRVYYRNQLVGRTNRSGDVFIPQLLPYQNNEIRIEPQDLPSNMLINEESRIVVPYFRSGVLVNFDVEKSNNAYFHLYFPDGSAVPAGSTAIIGMQSESFPVGYEGDVYATHLVSGSKINGKVILGDKVCHFHLPFNVSSSSVFHDLGKVLCH